MAWKKNDPSLGNDPSYLEPRINIAEQKVSALEAELPNKIDNSEKGAANGIASLNAEGKVVDAKGNEVEGKVKSVNGQTGDVEVPVFSGSYTDLSDKPTKFPPSSHTHTKSEVGLNNVDNVKQMPITGGTFTGISTAHNNTSYTVAQLRNVILSPADPTGGSNGDIWIKYV